MVVRALICDWQFVIVGNPRSVALINRRFPTIADRQTVSPKETPNKIQLYILQT